MSENRLLLVGAGHANLSILRSMRRLTSAGFEVTVVSPAARQYYSGMGPGMLGGRYAPKQISFPVRSMTEAAGGTFVEDAVVKVDAPNRIVRTAAGASIEYDVVSFNIGSHVPAFQKQADDDRIIPVKPIRNLHRAGLRMDQAAADGRSMAIAIVGGGPAALEVAGNAAARAKRSGLKADIRLFASQGLMVGKSDFIRRKAAASLKAAGVEALQSGHVDSVEGAVVRSKACEDFHADMVFIAAGVKPPDLFVRSGLPVGQDGGLLVDEQLQSAAHPGVFAGGDCLSFQPQTLDKVGVYAVRQNPVLLHNVQACLQKRPLRTFNPGGDYLLVYNLGDGTGLLEKRGVAFDGKPAFFIKDIIDRAFMRRFTMYD